MIWADSSFKIFFQENFNQNKKRFNKFGLGEICIKVSSSESVKNLFEAECFENLKGQEQVKEFPQKTLPKRTQRNFLLG